jgi:hypothetical protein
MLDQVDQPLPNFLQAPAQRTPHRVPQAPQFLTGAHRGRTATMPQTKPLQTKAPHDGQTQSPQDVQRNFICRSHGRRQTQSAPDLAPPLFQSLGPVEGFAERLAQQQANRSEPKPQPPQELSPRAIAARQCNELFKAYNLRVWEDGTGGNMIAFANDKGEKGAVLLRNADLKSAQSINEIYRLVCNILSTPEAHPIVQAHVPLKKMVVLDI